MRLKLNLVRPGDHPAVDLLVTTDATVTVADLAAALRRRDPAGPGIEVPLTIATWNGSTSQPFRPTATLAEAGLRSGQAVVLSPADDRFATPGESVAVLRVVSGPGAGREHPLHSGANEVGREAGNDVVLDDPFASKRHMRVNVTDSVEVVDLGSSNGIQVGGAAVTRAFVSSEDDITVGDTVLRIARSRGATASRDGNSSEAFVRSPRLEPRWQGPTLQLPQPPEQAGFTRMPIVPLVMPIVFGAVLFAVTRQPQTVLFVALSPLMMLGNLMEQRFGAKRAFREAETGFHEQRIELETQVDQLSEQEREGRHAEYPATRLLVRAVEERDPSLWSRRSDRAGWLQLRLGEGQMPSRIVLEPPGSKQGAPHLWKFLREIQSRAREVGPVPVVGDLTLCGAIGVAGPRPAALGISRSLVLQVVTLHSPAEVVLCGLASVRSAKDWEWLKWLPHTSSEHSPVGSDQLAAGAGQGGALLTALEEVVDARGDGPGGPIIVVLVEDDNGCDRSRVVELAERGPQVGIHVLWVAGHVAELPAACRVFISSDGRGPATVGSTEDGSTVEVVPEELSAEEAAVAARRLAPLVDAGARVDDDSDLPRSVASLQLVGRELAVSPAAVVDVWRTSGSLPGEDRASRTRSGLRATVGMGSGQELVLDLREQGPHALVGGTTGAGKSEFLQAWVMGMALEHSPSRVTFLFVDYKGGAAFSECTRLPHCVGLVTDLSPHLVRRALQSLNAELRHREHILQRKKAKDLFELERVGDPETPPSLVIVVDEFAALVHEVPEFVDGVVNVAQRGRSLGLNLILATQRPAGVIKDNLRANTNLRIALRMADEADSDDVVGSKVAASFSPSIPGRGVAKTGPGRLTPFQSGYVGGWTSESPPPPGITISELGFGTGAVWDEPEVVEVPVTGPNDLTRLVDNVISAHAQVQLPRPRRPWLDPLAEIYDMRKSPPTRTDSELVFGIADDPDNQVQRPVAFCPDEEGNMAVFGTGGTGKSTFLRTLALAAGAATRSGRCHVYGLDFGSRGLSMLEGLPHVGAIVNGDDEERVSRLLRQLRTIVDDRAERYAQVDASNIREYRAIRGHNKEARTLLLVDGVGSFRQGYEVGERGKLFDTFVSLAADGRQVGVHVVVSADRAGAVPTALGSLIQRRLVLRLSGENDYAMLSVKSDVLVAAPPGRGVIDGLETQVLVMGSSANTAEQAAVTHEYGRRLEQVLERAGAEPPAGVGRLPELVSLSELPLAGDGEAFVGLADDDLLPAAVSCRNALVLAGPPQSGRSTVLLTLTLAVSRAHGGRRVHFGPRLSDVAAGITWDASVVGANEVAESARKLAGDLDAWHSPDQPLTVVIESVPDFLQGEADGPLLELVKACRERGILVIAEGETSQMMSSWPLLQALRAGRTGIVLQPEQIEGENLFKTSLPRMSRQQFPVGRGVYIRSGRSRRIQFAVPDLTDGE